MERTSTAAALSLVEQVRRLSPPTEQPPEWEEPLGRVTGVPLKQEAEQMADQLLDQVETQFGLEPDEAEGVLPDGYRRVSTVQVYKMSESYRKRRRTLWILGLLLLLIAAGVGLYFLNEYYYFFW